jgi:hypothetical protein
MRFTGVAVVLPEWERSVAAVAWPSVAGLPTFAVAPV